MSAKITEGSATGPCEPRFRLNRPKSESAPKVRAQTPRGHEGGDRLPERGPGADIVVVLVSAQREVKKNACQDTHLLPGDYCIVARQTLAFMKRLGPVVGPLNVGTCS